MSELSYAAKLAAQFVKIERAVIGMIEHAPGLVTARSEKNIVHLGIDTAMMPHGAAAGPSLDTLAQTFEKHFGSEAVRLEQPSQLNMDMDLGIPPAYRLTLKVPDTHDSLVELANVHKDVAVNYCRTALMGDMDAQLDYLVSELGEAPGSEAFAHVTGMKLHHSPTTTHTSRFPKNSKKELVPAGR